MTFLPAAMRVAPELTPNPTHPKVSPRYALLINPFYPKDPHASFGKHVLTPTLALTSIAGSTPAEWEVSYWDENLLQGTPPSDPFPAVVGITVHLTFAKRAYELARWYRERGAKVIFGGLHVLSCPAEVAPHCDAYAIGEGVQLWGKILTDVANGTLKKKYQSDYLKPYSEDPYPRRDLLPRESFLTTTSVIATRGCHSRCDFCYLSTEGLQIPYMMKRVEQIAEEIQKDNQPYSVFIDNNLGSRRDYLRQLCQALRPLNKIWSAAVSIDVTEDPLLIKEMALSGCTGVFVGFESLQGENIIGSRKKSPLPDEYSRRVALFHRYGIQVNGSFVLGFDHDHLDVFEKTVAWIEANRLECATFHLLTPYPGTPLFKKMKSEGRILHQDWSLYDTANVVFQPKNMTQEELLQGYAWCYKRLFSHRSIWKRRPPEFGAVLPYLAMSYLYKRSNLIWYYLIRYRLTGFAWKMLVECSRRRHLRFRQQLQKNGPLAKRRISSIISPGV